jgi:hypothetical protein
MKVSQRPGAADRGAWPIAAPLERVAKLLRVDLGVVAEAAEQVAPYITADGRSLWSVKLIERAIDPDGGLGSTGGRPNGRRRRRPWQADRSAPGTRVGLAALEALLH